MTALSDTLHRFLRHYLLAVQFFTRIPVTGSLAQWTGFSPEMLRASATHFPGVGWLVGMAACVVFAVLSLGLPEDYFAPYYVQTDSTARLLHYPPLSTPPAAGQLRAGAHTDFGGINVLFQDDVGGLEIQMADGGWVPAPAMAGA